MMAIKVCCGDVLEIMKKIPNESVDLIFADPPFNIGLRYGDYDDNRADYKEWVEKWIDTGVRKLKKGGVFVIHHVPEAAMWIGQYMKDSLKFNSWIAWKTHKRPPSNRVTPEHRVFLVFSKGKARFHAWGDTAEHRKCKGCGAMIANWSGNKKYMNPDAT